MQEIKLIGSPTRVRINYCTQKDLMKLSGIGRKRAHQIIRFREQFGYFLTVEDLARVPSLSPQLVDGLIDQLDWSFNGHYVPKPQIKQGDARNLSDIREASIDLIVTSPPYWQKRDYGHRRQIGQEKTPELYVQELITTINSWIPLLRPHASVFINIGDTFRDCSLVGIPDMLALGLRRENWLIVNRIIWAKPNGVPEKRQDRLANRHETLFQLTRSCDYFADIYALAHHLGQSANPGDVWNIPQGRNTSDHLAPFPEELVRRIIAFACPEHICSECGQPYTRVLEPSFNLDITRPQARRAIELFKKANLSEKHLRAIRAVGISDAGKGKVTQSGAKNNDARVVRLAKEAKKALGGYFREFTFTPKQQVGWDKCECKGDTLPGTILDPFMGSGTSIRIGYQSGRVAIGVDLVPPTSVL